MKKILYVLTVVAFVACNNDASTAEDTKDSIENKMDSSTDAKIDSVHESADSITNKMDSANEAKKDTLKK